jgi:hypothetical protein
VATIAFYLLGAGVLHAMGLTPKGNDMIVVLSRIYTETLGGWALPVFYAGAIVTLYGTIFAATAAHSRIFADMARLLGLFRRDDYATRVRYRQVMVVLLTVAPVAVYLMIESPVQMVVLGGHGPVDHVAGVRLRHVVAAPPALAARGGAAPVGRRRCCGRRRC